MKVNGKEVTKEWYKCIVFERILGQIRKNAKSKDDLRFTRKELLDRINAGEFGGNLIASFSPQQGSIEEILSHHRSKGKEWLDVQNLTYHYSHQNPNGNYHSQTKMLEYLGGRGRDSKYAIIPHAS